MVIGRAGGGARATDDDEEDSESRALFAGSSPEIAPARRFRLFDPDADSEFDDPDDEDIGRLSIMCCRWKLLEIC